MIMLRGKRAHALSSAVAAARVAVAPRPDPRVAAELTRTLTARAAASFWAALVIIPFTIIAYDAAYFPAQLPRGVLAAVVADALIIALLVGLRRHVFDRQPWLPFALLAGVICNVTEAVNLMLTGGTAQSDFVFPYYLISFAIAVFFPAPVLAVVVTAALLPLGYLATALIGNEPLGAKHFISNLMLLADSALITCIGNRVVTNLFLREVTLRIDLEKANERLRELDRLKSEFFANVSHELRTPLTLILAPAASLSRETQGPLAEGQRTLVETIHRNATRLLQLINDLLLLAKLESGEPRIDRVPVDVGKSVLRLAEETQAYAHSLELRLEVEIAPGGPFIWSGDERHLDRIVLNLLSNACKFSRAGGGVRVAVGGDREGTWLSVVDEGIGIAPGDVERIFERFVQIDSSATRRFQGTGIGLSIVKQLITLHGGRIAVVSEPGRGSTFVVNLPGAPKAAMAAAPSSAPELPRVRLQPTLPAPARSIGEEGARVALVEDNADLLGYLAHELGRWYRVWPFSDSSRALREIAADPPDLIVSDIMMPGVDGITLARQIRADLRTAEVPVLLLSAREEVEAKLAGFEAGADDYVHKPFDLQELRARIELHLRLRAQARQIRESLEQLKKAETSLVQSEKMVALGRMVAGVAHEMNNPLHFLRGNLSLLRRHLPGDGAASPLLADIEESLERMTAITRQLLLFGRKQAGEGTGVVKLSEVVVLALKMMAPQVPRGVRIVQEIDGEAVRANPQDLFQVILNIVHNAVQAVDPEVGEVRIAAARAGDRIELSVIDNGCGISKENLAHIFEPFFTTKPPGSGTGLGLSIVQELIAAQQGTVRVESEPGRGTTVAVSLQAVNA
ncbi:MAG: ATP-binding protein [Myxococcales bacterium]